MAARLASSKATSASPSCLSKLCRLLSGWKPSPGSGTKSFVSPAKRTSTLSEEAGACDGDVQNLMLAA